MKNYFLHTEDSNGKRLPAEKYTSVVRSCSYAGKKYNAQMAKHIAYIDFLVKTEPELEGYTVFAESFKD